MYREIFFLCRTVGFSGEYVESLNPLERGLYMEYYKAEKIAEEKARQGTQQFDAMSPDLPQNMIPHQGI